jgi:2,3-dihydroxybenzoate-AMP ligase
MYRVKSPMPGVSYLPSDATEYYFREGVLTDETLIAALRKSFTEHADRIALSEPGILITYGELDRLTDRTAAALYRLGLRPTDRAIFQMRNCKELVQLVIACLKIGVIPVCTLAAHRQLEIGYLGNHTAAKIHFVHADDERFDLVAFAKEMKSQIETIRHIVTARGIGGEGASSIEELIQNENEAEARKIVDSIEHDALQVILFQLSGGTSGVPKVIPRFGNEYLYSIRTVIDRRELDRSTVMITGNPMMHNAAMVCFWMPTLLAGGEVAISPYVTTQELEHMMVERKPTWVGLAKVHMLRLVEAGGLDRIPRQQIKACVVNADAEAMSKIFDAPCTPLFGMTEGLLSFCSDADPAEAIARSVGRPLSAYDELVVVEPGTEDPVAPGASGELLVRGPCTIRGYYDADDRNKEAFTQSGFYRTGDLMAIREIDGTPFLFFEGRVKDVVDRGGEKINCGEVEALAALHPAIGDVLCVGMPDPVYGEKVCAFIIGRPGFDPLTVAELGTFLGEKGLAKFKYPERIEYVDIFPLTSSGKPSKPKMREYVTQKLLKEAQSV